MCASGNVTVEDHDLALNLSRPMSLFYEKELARYIPNAIWSRLVSSAGVQATHARVGMRTIGSVLGID
jgi:hypothetical protein